MANFKTVLGVNVNKDQFGRIKQPLMYSFVYSTMDLADGTCKIRKYGESVTIGEVCSLIDVFAPDDEHSKQWIKEFLEKDFFYKEEEF